MWWRLFLLAACTCAVFIFTVPAILTLGIEIRLPAADGEPVGADHVPMAEMILLWVLRGIGCLVVGVVGWIAFWLGRKIVRTHGTGPQTLR